MYLSSFELAQITTYASTSANDIDTQITQTANDVLQNDFSTPSARERQATPFVYHIFHCFHLVGSS
jgi:hypothetical protein